MKTRLAPGDPVNLEGRRAGRIGLFLTDGRSIFALTCSHVLNGATGDRVRSNGRLVGRLFWRVPLSAAGLRHPRSADPVAPNVMDSALAEIDASVPVTNRLPGGLGIVASVVADRPAIGTPVRHAIESGARAVVLAVRAGIRVIGQDGAELFFGGLTIVTPPASTPLPQSGDSGSLLVTVEERKAVGLVMARSEAFQATGSGGATFRHAIAISDIQPILDRLQTEHPRRWQILGA